MILYLIPARGGSNPLADVLPGQPAPHQTNGAVCHPENTGQQSARGRTTPNDDDLLIRELCERRVLPDSELMAEAEPVGVRHVLGARAVLQIGGSVVVRVAIQMIDFLFAEPRAKKSQRHDQVDILRHLRSIRAEADADPALSPSLARSLGELEQAAGLGGFASSRTPDPAEGGHLVVTLESNHRTPFFFHAQSVA